MVGFGKHYPLQPHHRGASCPVDVTEKCNFSFFESLKRNPIVLWGAIVGGPGRHDQFKDLRSVYQENMVALDKG
jgi:endoglucanase